MHFCSVLSKNLLLFQVFNSACSFKIIYEGPPERNSYSEVFSEKGVVRNFANFTEFSGIFRVKLVVKIIVFSSPGTHY